MLAIDPIDVLTIAPMNPADATRAETPQLAPIFHLADEHDAHLDRIRLTKELAADVDSWRQHFTQPISETIGTYLSDHDPAA